MVTWAFVTCLRGLIRRSRGNMFLLNEIGVGRAMQLFMKSQNLIASFLIEFSELGTSLFEIALSLFALERTLILGAMALLETKSEAL